jgi:hypothetical protein
MWGTLLKFAGSALGGFGAGAGKSRKEELEARMKRDELQLAREAQFNRDAIARDVNSRQSRAQAWRDLGRAEYIAKGGKESLGFGRLMTEARRPAPGSQRPNEGEMEAADGLRREVLDRLVHGDTLDRRYGYVQRSPITDDAQFNKLLKPSFMEKLAGWLSPVASGAGTLMSERRAPVVMNNTALVDPNDPLYDYLRQQEPAPEEDYSS